MFLSSEELDTEFERMWEGMKQELCNVIPEQDVCNRVKHVLLGHFRTATAKDLLSKSNIQSCGQEKFCVKKQWAVKKQGKPQQIQVFCDAVIRECENFVSEKIQNNIYNDTYIRNILTMIDKRMKDQEVSEECEVFLKLHVCGHAVREFQKVHNCIGDIKDLETHLKNLKPNLHAMFKRHVDIFV